MFKAIGYRVYEYFEKKERETAVSNTINFLSLLQGTLIVPVLMAINLFIKIDPQILGVDSRIKYYIGIPLAVLLIFVNTILFKKNLKGEALNNLKIRYEKERYLLPIWVIFSAPVVFVFVFPIVYGVINGTISFPFLENLLLTFYRKQSR